MKFLIVLLLFTNVAKASEIDISDFDVDEFLREYGNSKVTEQEANENQAKYEEMIRVVALENAMDELKQGVIEDARTCKGLPNKEQLRIINNIKDLKIKAAFSKICIPNKEK